MSTPTTRTKVERAELQAPPRAVGPRRELAHRVSGGMEVTLFWSAGDNSTSVEVWHPGSGQTLRFRVAPERALDAFYHPFSQLPTSLDVEVA